MARKTLIKRILPPKRLTGEIEVPGDKSISHRAIILNSLAIGNNRISNLSAGKDCLSTINCLRALGVKFARQTNEPSALCIHGTGIDGLAEAKNVLNAGNSGTTMRLSAGVLAACPFLSVIAGDASLRSRPMRRLIEPLRSMGADVHGRADDSYAPLVIKGGKLHGIRYALPVPSAQIKSAILLAGLFAEGDTIIEQTFHSRDHTERLLKQMGADLEYDDAHLCLKPLSSPLTSVDITIPGDISSAAYWLVAGAIHPNASIKILNCGINPTRTGIIDVLVAMKARLRIENQRNEANEPVADLVIESSQLKAIEVNGDIVPRLIDEIPVLAVAACMAHGNTIIRSAGELRVKESDRIATTVRELSRLGAKIEELPDGMVVHGGAALSGAEVKSHLDHRLAMSLTVAGLIAKGETTICGAQVAEVSYPDFWIQLERLTAG
jgi:3-phosphoshikimate 1-carboxyvinyltransferase